MADLSRKRDRERFSVRREPYWQKLEAGAYLGFRRGPDTWIARYRNRDGKQLYKRLGPGRMLGGVALGLAEATKLNVSVIRLLFFALFFFDGVGLIIYVLLVVFMPVHPDDRQHLLRFKLRRWMRRSSASPDAP